MTFEEQLEDLATRVENAGEIVVKRLLALVDEETYALCHSLAEGGDVEGAGALLMAKVEEATGLPYKIFVANVVAEISPVFPEVIPFIDSVIESM